MKNNRKFTRARKTTHQYNEDIFKVTRGRKTIHEEKYSFGLSGARISAILKRLREDYGSDRKNTITHYPRKLIRHNVERIGI